MELFKFRIIRIYHMLCRDMFSPVVILLTTGAWETEGVAYSPSAPGSYFFMHVSTNRDSPTFECDSA